MSDIEQLKRKLTEKKGELSSRYGIKQIGIFGSYVRGEQTQNSDLDILVDVDENSKMSLFDFVHAGNELSDSLGVRVDLVMKSGLKPGIGSRILKEVVYV